MTEKDCNNNEPDISSRDLNNPLATMLSMLEEEMGSARNYDSMEYKRKRLSRVTENAQRAISSWIECLGQVSWDICTNGANHPSEVDLVAQCADMIRQLAAMNDVLIGLDGLAKLKVEES